MANIRLLQGWGTWRHIIEIGLDAKMLSTSPPLVGGLPRFCPFHQNILQNNSSEHFAKQFIRTFCKQIHQNILQNISKQGMCNCIRATIPSRPAGQGLVGVKYLLNDSTLPEYVSDLL